MCFQSQELKRCIWFLQLHSILVSRAIPSLVWMIYITVGRKLLFTYRNQNSWLHSVKTLLILEHCFWEIVTFYLSSITNYLSVGKEKLLARNDINPSFQMLFVDARWVERRTSRFVTRSFFKGWKNKPLRVCSQKDVFSRARGSRISSLEPEAWSQWCWSLVWGFE